ncbi:excalibur calcium-binding domain-containing protein [Asticcacaulis taihuensis]|uniref:excalibur calcium-binding domain-containing protein n=1 Tax=Asticcacaulis taihuensis TaxID=260084 RepID=UPI0026EFED26|nr:excalibur calcium-binding domain-containing protein [Asticcacaulis taihuensis]
MRHDAKRKGLSWGEMVFCLAILVAVVFILKPVLMGPPAAWTAEMQAKHLAARAGCREAQAQGLTPAHRGQPGYWPEWDGDNDGISCERW